MSKFKKYEGKLWGDDNPDVIFYCEGCKCDHGIWTTQPNHRNATWQFNGDMDKPTVTPSLHMDTPGRVCHSFITNGNIQYLDDCCHALKGQTIELPEYED